MSTVARPFAARLAKQGIWVCEIRSGLIDTDVTAPVQAAHERRIQDGLSPIRR